MLPKLTSIHKRRSLVFIIATNHVGEFDLAIRRRGRFDRVVQVMPPTYEAKMAKHNWGPERSLDLKGRLDELRVNLNEEVVRQIGDLTYDECEEFVVELYKTSSAQDAATALSAIWSQCTLLTSVSQEEQSITWADRCRAEAQLSHWRSPLPSASWLPVTASWPALLPRIRQRGLLRQRKIQSGVLFASSWLSKSQRKWLVGSLRGLSLRTRA